MATKIQHLIGMCVDQRTTFVLLADNATLKIDLIMDTDKCYYYWNHSYQMKKHSPLVELGSQWISSKMLNC